jgi:predicted porin
MKKNVIALAVAAAMAAPLAAQAEVTVSGGLQAELRSVGGDGLSLEKGLYATDGGEFGSENGGNYGFIAFSAAEDLGNGLKAIAKWVGNIHVGDGSVAGGITGRDAYVGLSGGFGTVLAGTLSSPYKSSTAGWDPMLATSLQARGNGGMSVLHNGYVGNAVAYANKFGPATVVAAVVLDEGSEAPASDKTNGKHSVSFSVNVPVGPVEVAVAYLDASKNADLVGPAAEDVKATKVGAKFAAGALTVAAQVELMDKGFSPVAEKGNVAYVTGSYAMGSNIFSAAYGRADKELVDNVNDATYTMVALNHKFSKATNVFVGYRNSDIADVQENTVSAGLRVNF